MSLSILPTAMFRRHPDSAYRAIDDEGGLVVLPGRAEVKVLNAVGVMVFGLLDGNHSVGDIVARVTGEYEVPEQQALDDVREFLGELAEHGMLAEVVKGSAGSPAADELQSREEEVRS